MREGRGSPWRRMLKVLLAYSVLSLLLMPFLQGLQRLLFLPELFMRLASGALILGLPLALLVAWRYPDIGGG